MLPHVYSSSCLILMLLLMLIMVLMLMHDPYKCYSCSAPPHASCSSSATCSMFLLLLLPSSFLLMLLHHMHACPHGSMWMLLMHAPHDACSMLITPHLISCITIHAPPPHSTTSLMLLHPHAYFLCCCFSTWFLVPHQHCISQSFLHSCIASLVIIVQLVLVP
jgi:hypothetical protein